MNLSIENQIAHYKEWRKGVLSVSFFEILLILVVLGLVITMIYVCTRFTKGPASITALKKYLNDLQAKFTNPQTVNAEMERGSVEILIKNVKASCDERVISGNADLKALMDKTCKQIKHITEGKEAGNKSSWLKFNAVTSSFNDYYFYKLI